MPAASEPTVPGAPGDEPDETPIPSYELAVEDALAAVGARRGLTVDAADVAHEIAHLVRDTAINPSAPGAVIAVLAVSLPAPHQHALVTSTGGRGFDLVDYQPYNIAKSDRLFDVRVTELVAERQLDRRLCVADSDPDAKSGGRGTPAVRWKG